MCEQLVRNESWTENSQPSLVSVTGANYCYATRQPSCVQKFCKSQKSGLKKYVYSICVCVHAKIISIYHNWPVFHITEEQGEAYCLPGSEQIKSWEHQNLWCVNDIKCEWFWRTNRVLQTGNACGCVQKTSFWVFLCTERTSQPWFHIAYPWIFCSRRLYGCPLFS